MRNVNTYKLNIRSVVENQSENYCLFYFYFITTLLAVIAKSTKDSAVCAHDIINLKIKRFRFVLFP